MMKSMFHVPSRSNYVPIELKTLFLIPTYIIQYCHYDVSHLFKSPVNFVSYGMV